MIYVKNPNLNSVGEFIMSLKDYTHSTLSSKFVETYTDPECTVQQCRVANRSINAVVEIVQTYFPDQTIESVLKEIQKLQITMIRCPDIQKFVFYFLSSDSNPDFMAHWERRKNDPDYQLSVTIVSDDYIDNDGYSIPIIKNLLQNVQQSCV